MWWRFPDNGGCTHHLLETGGLCRGFFARLWAARALRWTPTRMQPRDLHHRQKSSGCGWPAMCCILALGLVVLQLVPAGANSRLRQTGGLALVEGPSSTMAAEPQRSVPVWQPRMAGATLPPEAATPAPLPAAAAPAPNLVEGAAAAATATVAASATPSSPALVMQPLPNCSVVFFHHLEKTGGTTLRSVLQRHAQLGVFDFVSFVNRFDKLQFQVVLHRLWTLLSTPGGLADLRLSVEIHIGGHRDHAFFLKYTVPDLPLLRSALRAAGCRCNLVTLLRHPLLQHLSWHYHFVNHRVPLCFWSNPADCKARLAMGPTCHDGPNAVGPNAMGPTCHSEPPRRRRAAVATLRPSGRH